MLMLPGQWIKDKMTEYLQRLKQRHNKHHMKLMQVVEKEQCKDIMSCECLVELLSMLAAKKEIS